MLTLLSVFLQAQENYKIRKINFHGNKAIEESDLQDVMAAKEVSWLQQLVNKKEPSLYNQDLMNMDLERILQVYHQEGYMNAKDSLVVQRINENRQSVKLAIYIAEGHPYRVDSLTFSFPKLSPLNEDSLAAALRHKLVLHKGKRFRDVALNNDVSLIQNAFRNRGYAYATADYVLHLNPGKLKVTIHYSVTPGPLCKFGEISIRGNKHTTAASIKKQLTIHTGKIYNRHQLDRSRENLYHLQLFRIVSVNPQKDPKTLQNPIPVRLLIKEAPQVTTRLGVGYGTEDKIRAYVDMDLLGIFNTTSRLNLYIKHSDLVPYSVSIKWTQPNFPGINSTLAVNPFLERNSEPGYETRTYGVNVPFTYQVNRWLTSSLTFYRQDVKQKAEAEDADIPGREDEDFLYNKSGIILKTVINTSTPTFDPNRGINISTGLKINGYAFGTDFSYTRLWADLRKYQSLGSCVLAFRLMGGGINSADESQYIPVEDRYYAGGSNSVRGWSRSMLGPLRSNGKPLGGKSILEGNMELRFPLVWKVSGVTFLDFGNVWQPSYSYHLNELAYAAGGGLRVDTPIGPIRFDVGMPVWNTKKTPQFFISVGQAF